jgi:hypothetical protein
LTHHARELEVLAVEIKGSFCGPNPPDNVPPFLAKDVTVIVFELAHSEHVELIDIPAADDIKGETALPNMVGRDHLLGRQDRMKKRDMDCVEDSYVVGLGQQPRSPGNSFENRSLEVSLATIAFPAPYRHDAFQSAAVGHLRQLQIVLPARVPALRNLGRRYPAGAVGGKQPQFEPIAIEICRCAWP